MEIMTTRELKERLSDLQGQEVTLQYWFNDDTVSDEDYIHVTVSSLQDNDVLLDMTNNTATVSINPLDNQRILFTPTESGIYHFIADARDSESLITTEVLMQSETGEWYGRSGCAGRDAHYMYISYDCEANATYSFRVMPNTADWTGTANVSIVTLADVPIALDQANERSMTPDTFDFYQYQAEESGSYTLTLNSIQLGGMLKKMNPESLFRSVVKTISRSAIIGGGCTKTRVRPLNLKRVSSYRLHLVMAITKRTFTSHSPFPKQRPPLIQLAN